MWKSSSGGQEYHIHETHFGLPYPEELYVCFVCHETGFDSAIECVLVGNAKEENTD